MKSDFRNLLLYRNFSERREKVIFYKYCLSFLSIPCKYVYILSQSNRCNQERSTKLIEFKVVLSTVLFRQCNLRHIGILSLLKEHLFST